MNNYEFNFFSPARQDVVRIVMLMVILMIAHIKVLELKITSEIIRTYHLSILERDELFKTILTNKTILLRAGEKLTATSLIKHKILTTDLFTQNHIGTQVF